MPRIFISYRRVDSHIITGRVHDWLVFAFGEKNVFKDVDDIPPGMDFRMVLRNALDKCDAVLAVIGSEWLENRDSQGRRRIDLPDDFVRMEIEAALSRDDVLVIPVLVNGAVMPTVDELPLKLRPLAYRNAVTIRHDPDFQRDMARLIDQLSRIRSKKLVFAGNKPVAPAIYPQFNTPEMRNSVEKLIAHLNHSSYTTNDMLATPVPDLMTNEAVMRPRVDTQQLAFLGMAFVLTLAVILTLVMLLGQAPDATPVVAQSVTETATVQQSPANFTAEVRVIPPVVFEADPTKTLEPTFTPTPTDLPPDFTSEPTIEWINEATLTARAPLIQSAIRRNSTPFGWQVGLDVVVAQDTALYSEAGNWASPIGLLNAGTIVSLRLGRHNGRSLLWYYDSEEVWFAVNTDTEFGWLPLRVLTLPN
ncbi:MAG TPA: toll/interleukin-1 receptor domain-containing protein [Aggregatilineales bacterium]|nr:toll/interleukin-1 receptor domain-containing protein [Aggregatilineales bacterium]